jgi:hypothetical protein
MSLLSIVALGFLLGLRHATDADHVVAVTTIVSRQRSAVGAAAIGALWGVGHTVTIVAVGGAIILLKLAVPPRLGLAAEFLVGIMLIGLGLVNLARRSPSVAVAPVGRARPLLIGIVHGLAGSAAIALLVLTAISDPRWAMAYLVIFGAGTVAGMVLITAALALPMRAAAVRFASAEHALRLASGGLSLAFGLFVAYRIGVTDGLFTAHPHWTPQ